MKDLTIDVDVLMRGSGIGNPEYKKESFFLMKNMFKLDSWFLALDDRGRIKHQYEIKIGGTFGQMWLKRMIDEKKIIIVEWIGINRGTKTKLVEKHFNAYCSEDFKYVETAAETSCKILVTHDPDYSIGVRRVLRNRLGITVNSALECVLLQESNNNQ